jgi:hypothetical protein
VGKRYSLQESSENDIFEKEGDSMGFDLIAIEPKSEKYAGWRNNVWWWRELARFVIYRCEHLMKEEEMRYWQTNDGQMVSKNTAEAIAKELQRLISNGTVKAYAKQYMKDMKAVPDVKCDYCKGTGKRNDKYVKGKCNSCNGTGQVRPWICSYPFSEGNVKDFAKFCQNSGGFEIW